MKSSVIKRSIVIQHRKTSVSLEDEFWTAFKEIARARDVRLSELVAAVKAERQNSNLSSAVRLFVLDFYRQICECTSNPVHEIWNRRHECRRLSSSASP